MNSKHANRIFLSIIWLHIAVIIVWMFLAPDRDLGMIANFLISQSMLLVPAVIGTILAGDHPLRLAGFRRIRLSTAGVICVFTFLCMPLTTTVNIFTLFFVDNTAAMMSGQILELPFVISWLMVGVLGPLCEEFVFRGILYQGYRRSGSALAAVFLSAVLFGLGHMNLNQAAYAFVIGIVVALLAEAIGSLWGPVIFHVVFNSSQVVLMYFTGELTDGGGQTAATATALTPDLLMVMLSVWLVISMVTTAFAGFLLVWIAKNEKRESALKHVWKGRKEQKEHMVTVPLIGAVVTACFYMGLLIVIPYAFRG